MTASISNSAFHRISLVFVVIVVVIIIDVYQKETESKSTAVKPLTANVVRTPPQPPAKQHKDKDRTSVIALQHKNKEKAQQPMTAVPYKDKDKTALQPITSKAQHSEFCHICFAKICSHIL